MGGLHVSNSYTVKLDPTLAPEVKAFLASHDFQFGELVNALWVAKGIDCRCTFYRSGKLLIQGKEAEVWRGLLQAVDPTLRPFAEGLRFHPSPPPQVWAGSDESGKGDYFGPLVICAAKVHRRQLEELSLMGVQDSKNLSDTKILGLADQLKAACPHQVVKIGPGRYNALYPKFGSLNRFMGWAHAKAIAELTKREQVEWVLVDKFGEPSLVDRRLAQDDFQLTVTHRTKAESDPAVAVASVIARAVFVDGLARLSRQYGETLKPGAGDQTVAIARNLVAKHGRGILADVAKVHFANTEKI